MADHQAEYVPKFTITPRLAAQTAHAARLAAEIESFPVQRIALTVLERAALERRVHASVSLEGNPLTEAEVARVLRRPHAPSEDAWAKEVRNYADALRLAERWAGAAGISEAQVLALHRAVGRGLIRPAGAYRERPLIVRDPDLLTVVYHAPTSGMVGGLTRAVVAWLNGRGARQLPWPILGGIVHARLVRIHPFADGNGRVARLATHLVLRQQGCQWLRQVALEPFYHANRVRYFRALRTMDAGRDDPMTRWLEYFVEGVVRVLSVHRQALPRAVLQLRARGTGTLVRLRSEQMELCARLPRGGTVTASEYAERFVVSLRTAQYHVQGLAAAGWLKAHGARKGRFYVRVR